MLNNVKMRGGGAKSSINQQKKAFTFVEIILVMALISILYVVTTKVIQHNLEKKVPTYVYYLYKNLDNETKLLTKKLLENANKEGSSSGTNSEETNGANNNTSKKTIEEVLKNLDAKSYCEAFAEDTNLVGHIDCENSVKNELNGESKDKTISYNCTRTYSFNVNDDGSYYEVLNPTYNSTLNQCINNTNFDDNVINCNANPTIAINDLLKNNTDENYTYTCTKSEEVEEDGNDDNTQSNNIFDVNTKPNLQNALKTTNNIHLNFMTLTSPKPKKIYNLLVNINQDAICPKILRSKFKTSPLIQCTIGFSSYNLSGNLYGSNSTIQYKREPYSFYCLKSTGFLKVSDEVSSVSEASLMGMIKNIPTMTDNCVGYIQHSKEMSEFKQINFIDYKDKKVWYPGVSGSYCSSTTDNKTKEYCAIDPPETPGVAFLYINVSLNNDTILDNESQNFAHQIYYNKWNNFFNNNPNFPKLTKAAISSLNVNEGCIESDEIKPESSGSEGYLSHFIYTSIDTPFSKGKMNKDIFVFEHFKDKIIPVGYLANNKNTPLKFDVITRDPVTYKIKKVNNKPLTYCEAMEYTGEKFSKYCNCKDKDEKVITQYEEMKDSSCKNAFGCIIRPVKPGIKK